MVRLVEQNDSTDNSAMSIINYSCAITVVVGIHIKFDSDNKYYTMNIPVTYTCKYI